MIIPYVHKAGQCPATPAPRGATAFATGCPYCGAQIAPDRQVCHICAIRNGVCERCGYLKDPPPSRTPDELKDQHGDGALNGTL